jgi:chromosome segregation protein
MIRQESEIDVLEEEELSSVKEQPPSEGGAAVPNAQDADGSSVATVEEVFTEAAQAKAFVQHTEDQTDATQPAETVDVSQNNQEHHLSLKSMKLAGFKSFVDPTVISFPSHLIGIVGPNGCGKSNIIDAVLWVMGETSAKYLRGESMADVIFNGSTTRQPVGQAVVELVFNNPHGALGGEYAKYSEIAIRRQVTRDGQSNYYLNNVRCRRRDIIDIFLGTGLGPRSYAIITQGTISRVIEAKPDEMRTYLEEAAGISKYKERRRETENRMAHTRDNLDRLNDLREELDKQLQHLQRQAKAAERYQALTQDKQRYEAELHALNWQALEQQRASKKQEIQEYSHELEAHTTEQVSLTTAIERARETHQTYAEHFNQVQKRYYDIGARVAQQEQSLKHHKEKVQQYQQDLEQLQYALTESESQMTDDQQSYQHWQQEIAGLAEVTPLRQQCEQAEQALAVAEQAVQDWQIDWEHFNNAAAKSSQQAQVQQTQIQHYEHAQQAMLKRIERLQQEKAEISPDRFQQEINEYTVQLSHLKQQQQEHQQALQQLNEQRQQNRVQQQQIFTEITQVDKQLQVSRTRYASLTGLQQAALGQHNKHVMQWLQQHHLSEKTRLATLLQVQEGWERAVETVLSPYLQAVCIDDCQQLTESITQLSQGSVSFIAAKASSFEMHVDFPLPSLLEKVQNNHAVGGFLAHVFCAADITTALSYQGQLQAQQSIITQDGIWVGENWLRVAKVTDEKSGVIERERELKTLQNTIEKQQQDLEKLQTQKETLQQHIQSYEQQRDEQQQKIAQCTTELSDIQLQLKIRQNRTEQLQQRLQQIDRELHDIEQQQVTTQTELQRARGIWQEAMSALEQQSIEREQWQLKKSHHDEALRQAKQTQQTSRQQWHELTLKRQTVETSLQAKQQSIARLEQQLEQLRQQRQRLETHLQEAEHPIESMQQSLQTQLEQRLQSQEALDQATRDVQTIENTLRETEKVKNTLAQRIDDMRQKLERSKLQQESLLVRQAGILEQLEKIEQPLEKVIATLTEEANVEVWQQQLEQLNNRIQRLGAINLAAIDEYQTQLERKTYLDRQNDDLVEALTILEGAIHKINRETRHLFKQTFDAVNRGFQTLFPKVFTGGTASLVLNDDDLLNAGVVVMAQPPGKRNSSIHLLSGGEKALTAIALVFAIFQLNPAPFCMLDEVDAPLDDANVVRYSNLVKDMSKDIQFIFISHNKNAIEMADHLAGVTMHEAGVSRMVSVDVEQAIALAEH